MGCFPLSINKQASKEIRMFSCSGQLSYLAYYCNSGIANQLQSLNSKWGFVPPRNPDVACLNKTTINGLTYLWFANPWIATLFEPDQIFEASFRICFLIHFQQPCLPAYITIYVQRRSGIIFLICVEFSFPPSFAPVIINEMFSLCVK